MSVVQFRLGHSRVQGTRTSSTRWCLEQLWGCCASHLVMKGSALLMWPCRGAGTLDIIEVPGSSECWAAATCLSVAAPHASDSDVRAQVTWTSWRCWAPATRCCRASPRAWRPRPARPRPRPRASARRWPRRLRGARARCQVVPSAALTHGAPAWETGRGAAVQRVKVQTHGWRTSCSGRPLLSPTEVPCASGLEASGIARCSAGRSTHGAGVACRSPRVETP